jgi:hypothetical protein
VGYEATDLSEPATGRRSAGSLGIFSPTAPAKADYHDGMSSVLILCEIEKRLGLATVLSRHIQAEPVAM